MTLPLERLAPGGDAIVERLSVPAHDAEWLRAVGFFEGQRVRVLRRAPWGGPIHVRLGHDGEFAVDRTLAREIDVRAQAVGNDDD